MMTVPGPLIAAAGPWSSGEEDAAATALSDASCIVAKTVTATPRAGNPPPVLRRLQGPCGGFLNRIGLRNAGADEFCRSLLPRLFAAGVPIVQSFTAQSEEEVESIFAALEPQRIVGYELNASCPNAPGGQLDPLVLARVLRRARALTRRPIWIKLAYAPEELLLLRARVCAEEGGDALTAVNTLPALDVEVRIAPQEAPCVTQFLGGISGPALAPLARFAVAKLTAAQPLPVIACGGVRTLSDVLSFLSIGACAVQIGSAIFDDPEVFSRLERELAEVCDTLRVASFAELREVLCRRS
jgi:dihydroorotate dehydrogenase (NAD+) catalytic subunit